MRTFFKSMLKEFREFESVASLLTGFLLIILAAGFVLGLIYFGQRYPKKGDTLVTASPSPTPIVTSLPATTENEGEKTSLPVIYKVAPGDSTWKVAQAFYGDGNLLTKIEAANNFQPGQQLEVGQEVLVPALDGSEVATIASPAPTASPEATVTPAPSAAASPATENVTASPTPEPSPEVTSESKPADAQTYVIKKGDSLWKIAQEQLGDPYRWVEIYQANKAVIGRNPNLIYPGVELRLVK